MKKNKVELTFIIHDFNDISHQELTTMLGLTPTLIAIKGDKRMPQNPNSGLFKQNTWGIHSGLDEYSLYIPFAFLHSLSIAVFVDLIINFICQRIRIMIMELFKNLSMKIKPIFHYLTLAMLISSCNLDLNDDPGTKMSYSIKDAKSEGTFLCEYHLKNHDAINHVKISSIFAEKQYWRDEGFLLKKHIDCCNSQLLILSADEPFSTQSRGYDKDWKIIGFTNPSQTASVLFRNYRGVIFPDSIPIRVVTINGQDSAKLIQDLMLYKR